MLPYLPSYSGGQKFHSRANMCETVGHGWWRGCSERLGLPSKTPTLLVPGVSPWPELGWRGTQQLSFTLYTVLYARSMFKGGGERRCAGRDPTKQQRFQPRCSLLDDINRRVIGPLLLSSPVHPSLGSRIPCIPQPRPVTEH